MPVIKCESNGKWRIGSGECKYETREKAVEVWQAILASGAYAALKVSIDYDDVLSTDKGKELAKRLISEGVTLYIISARRDAEGMLGVAKDLGIPERRIYATGSNKAKVEKIKELGIARHYDNNQEVIDKVNEISKGVKFDG